MKETGQPPGLYPIANFKLIPIGRCCQMSKLWMTCSRNLLEDCDAQLMYTMDDTPLHPSEATAEQVSPFYIRPETNLIDVWVGSSYWIKYLSRFHFAPPA